MKYFTYFIIAVVAAAIIAGFFIVGSPQEERLRRFDDQRLQDLQTIQSQIIYYRQRKRALPTQLVDLQDDISGIIIPGDPATGAAYQYQVTAADSFTLCAVFNRDNKTANSTKPVPARIPPDAYWPADNWQHPAGEYCFSRTIDKDLYPPLKDK